LVIYDRLKSSFKYPINFFIKGDFLDEINHKNISPIYIPSNESFDKFINNLIKPSELQIFLFDIKDSEITNNIKQILIKIQINNGIIISVDSLLSFQDEIDFFFMPSFRKPIGIKKRHQNKFSYGWENFLINSKYSQPNFSEKSNSLLIITGGSDPTNLGEYYPEIIDTKIKNTTIKWIVGPFSRQPNLKVSSVNNWELCQSPKSLDNLMHNSKFAICVFGVSFFELLYYGVATVVFSPYGDKDKNELEDLKKYEIAIIATDEKDAVEKIHLLMNSKALSKKISDNAKKMFLKKGQDNLLKQVKKIVNEKWQVVI